MKVIPSNKGKKIKRKTTLATCQDCFTGWPVYASSPMKKCPICGGAVEVERSV